MQYRWCVYICLYCGDDGTQHRCVIRCCYLEASSGRITVWMVVFANFLKYFDSIENEEELTRCTGKLLPGKQIMWMWACDVRITCTSETKVFKRCYCYSFLIPAPEWEWEHTSIWNLYDANMMEGGHWIEIEFHIMYTDGVLYLLRDGCVKRY